MISMMLSSANGAGIKKKNLVHQVLAFNLEVQYSY